MANEQSLFLGCAQLWHVGDFLLGYCEGHGVVVIRGYVAVVSVAFPVSYLPTACVWILSYVCELFRISRGLSEFSCLVNDLLVCRMGPGVV